MWSSCEAHWLVVPLQVRYTVEPSLRNEDISLNQDTVCDSNYIEMCTKLPLKWGHLLWSHYVVPRASGIQRFHCNSSNKVTVNDRCFLYIVSLPPIKVHIQQCQPVSVHLTCVKALVLSWHLWIHGKRPHCRILLYNIIIWSGWSHVSEECSSLEPTANIWEK